MDFRGIITVYLGNCSHVEILTPVWACGCPGYPLPCLGDIEPPHGLL